MRLTWDLGTGVNYHEDVISRLPGGDLVACGMGFKGIDNQSVEGAVRRIKEQCPVNFTEDEDKTAERGLARVELCLCVNLTHQHINQTHFEASDVQVMREVVSWRCRDTMRLLVCDMSRNQVSNRRQVCGKKSVNVIINYGHSDGSNMP
jgi:hypothetical protein